MTILIINSIELLLISIPQYKPLYFSFKNELYIIPLIKQNTPTKVLLLNINIHKLAKQIGVNAE